MKHTFWFICMLMLSLTSNTKPFDHAYILPNMPNFPSNVSHQIPIYNEQTGQIETYVPASIAKIAYILINAPEELRANIMQAHGIHITTYHTIP